uniref:Uncharacterized protein n=1 Tax=Yersinia enterocolitica W22703 TaxID=913028 RepID=F4MVJ2_YEREN|nr:unknown protein [Yersinia enterocolitica W22703]
MDKLVIKTATEDDFFKRGKKLATLADTEQPLPQEHTITFEDPLEMVRVLSAARIVLLRTVKNVSGFYHLPLNSPKKGSQCCHP